jgi:hypothetical protein
MAHAPLPTLTSGAMLVRRSASEQFIAANQCRYHQLQGQLQVANLLQDSDDARQAIASIGGLWSQLHESGVIFYDPYDARNLLYQLGYCWADIALTLCGCYTNICEVPLECLGEFHRLIDGATLPAPEKIVLPRIPVNISSQLSRWFKKLPETTVAIEEATKLHELFQQRRKQLLHLLELATQEQEPPFLMV